MTKARLYGILSNSKWERRNGGIGRRPGLKIPCDESHVPVRARFPAPDGFPQTNQYRGVEQLVARRAHNPEVVWFKSFPRSHIVKPKKISWLRTPEISRFRGFFSRFLAFSQPWGLRIQSAEKKDIISKKRLRTGFEPCSIRF